MTLPLWHLRITVHYVLWFLLVCNIGLVVAVAVCLSALREILNPQEDTKTLNKLVRNLNNQSKALDASMNKWDSWFAVKSQEIESFYESLHERI